MKQHKLYEQVEKVLSNEIAEGVYKPGEPMPAERELMERFEVGRPSIREALFSLARRGLIEVGSGRRPRVLEPNFDNVIGEIDLIVRQVLNKPENIQHLMELRRILECALARKFAIEATDEQIEVLRGHLKNNHNTIGHLEEFWKSDSDFHSAIARMNDNPVLPIIVDVILNWLIDNRRITLTTPGLDEVAVADHELIFDAIVRHAPDDAEKAMSDHLLRVEGRVNEILIANKK